MIVYLDLLIADNFFADAALLYCAVKTVKGKVSFLRIALTALLGTALGVGYTIFTLYFTVPFAVDCLVKYGVAFLLPLPAAKWKRKRSYLLCALAFVGYMFAFAGMLTALFAKITPNDSHGALTYTLCGLPSGVVLAAVVAFAFVSVRIVLRLNERRKSLLMVCECELVLGSARVKARGFTDTGNRLHDKDGKSVAIVERSVACALLADQLFSGRIPFGKIEVQTVNGKSFFSVFQIDCLQIYFEKKVNIIKNVTVAISPQPLGGEYGVIVPASFMVKEDFHVQGGEKC